MKVNSAFDLRVKTKVEVCQDHTLQTWFQNIAKKKTKITNQGNSTGK